MITAGAISIAVVLIVVEIVEEAARQRSNSAHLLNAQDGPIIREGEFI